ncbi:MAG: TIGR00289 family protein [Candidatus Bathyarchaeota archaeon]|nr:TIGR00289 family protein [Candidatus Bathyarchaeota archaeon]MDH5786860.1 TIGR00289 family protein [Candidatus Bathyarchaeota archaeon]
MRLAVLATGGKDSTLALHRVLKKSYDVEYLVCMVPLSEDSWMFHYPNICLIDLFAEAVGIPLVKAETAGIKEKEVGDLKRLIGTLDVEGIVSGAIASNYQKTRIERICKQLKLKCITPLWHENPQGMLSEILDLNFEAIITGVYAHGFSREWLGRKIDDAAVADLIELNKQYGVSLVGEGGEYETLVLDTLFFKRRIKVVEAEKIWKGESGYFLVTKAESESK